MKKVLVTLALVGLFVAPSFGLLTAKVTVDDAEINVGESTTVRVWAIDTDDAAAFKGIYSVAVNVLSSADVISATLPAEVVLPFGETGALASLTGTPGANGGVNDLAATVATFPPHYEVGLTDWVEVFRYQVTATAEGETDLSLSLRTGGGWKGISTWGGALGVAGDLQGTTLTVVPEPASLALLAMGGLALLRRRMA